MILRVAFIVLALAAIGGAAYTGYYGRGGESSDLDKSIRAGSGGAVLTGRVK
ncbi:hypothetical protein [Thetidibacter halocola]|uniref:Uncharacterized protein n=1 Tax=Thetidibacter halocola TaxID=2827239 RepID=A0A8J8B8U2_9RHOB|nr:hypothetical protein [Thetidibacter halocola]MBS0126601.1 hypothetical protein [Thetidibacter halocola]